MISDLKLHPLQANRLGRVLTAEAEAHPGDGIRILVVEDDHDHAAIVRRTLERQDFGVTVVGDGPACLEAVAAQAYSLILLDYSLPRMNGLQVLAELRARGVWAPVVMVTAQGDERLAIESMKAGGMDFVVKTSGYLVALPTVLRKVLKQHELAVENDHLHRETQRRLRDAEALVDLSRALTWTLDLEALIGVVGSAAARACNMPRCSIFDCRDGQARLLASQFTSGALDTTSFPSFRGPAGQPARTLPFLASALERREAVVISDPGGDPSVPLALLGFQPGTLLVLPLLRQDAAIGALVLDRSENGPPVTPSRVTLGMTVASQVALALENARLYVETERALTELKDAQDRLVRGETLRALGELASGAAHHLNNLLAIIAGRAQLLLHTVETPDIRRPLQIIERSALDGAEVVRRIQEFARTRQSDDLEPVDLNQVAIDVIEMTRVRWQDAAVAQSISVQVTDDLGATLPVLGHAAALREVLTNLILNAIDALPRGGHIAVRTRIDGAAAVLTVTDDGVGMTKEVLRRAQEPFFTTKGVKSTGLGLSVAYGIVRRHGGEVSLASTPGQGTVVTLRLPTAPDSGLSAGSSTSVAAGTWRVLVVDDEAEVRRAVVDMLEAMGHTVLAARDGAEALAQLTAGAAPDVVLTDLGMPGMTGPDLARAIKARWPTLPVGLFTGWGQPAAADSKGAADFVMIKPLNFDRLLATIAHWAPRFTTNGLTVSDFQR